jgi:hypothetical protein
MQRMPKPESLRQGWQVHEAQEQASGKARQEGLLMGRRVHWSGHYCVKGHAIRKAVRPSGSMSAKDFAESINWQPGFYYVDGAHYQVKPPTEQPAAKGSE